MPKFRINAAATIYYRGVVEAESREALDEMDLESMDLEEYDGGGMEVVEIEIVDPSIEGGLTP